MPLIATHEIEIDGGSPQIYCGLDSLLTSEVLVELQSLLPGDNAPLESRGPALIYNFELAMQAPAIEMMLRGWRIDPWAREQSMEETRKKLQRLSDIIDQLTAAVSDQLRNTTKPSSNYPYPRALNPNSGDQLRTLFYDVMKLPRVVRHKDGKETFPMDAAALERIALYFHGRPFVNAILAYRQLAKQLETIEMEVDDDWRMRTSYNIASAKTFRWSSSKSPTGTGGNLQNIEESLRAMFVADMGYKLIGVDLEQAESREIGWLCGVLFDRWKYLDACESGDLHTANARIAWPHLGWDGTPEHDRRIADQKCYRHHSYREIAKRYAHAFSYLGQPPEVAKQTHTPLEIARAFQHNFFLAYPEIPMLHTWVAGQLQRNHFLINTFGARRDFFGRADSNDTIKEAVAHLGQSTTLHRISLGLWRVWRYMHNRVQLLGQLHDAIYAQRLERDTDEGEIVAEIQHHLDVPLSFRGRTYTVPSEPKVGWCWASAYALDRDGVPHLRYPDGMMKYSPDKPDTRTRTNTLHFGAVAA